MRIILSCRSSFLHLETTGQEELVRKRYAPHKRVELSVVCKQQQDRERHHFNRMQWQRQCSTYLNRAELGCAWIVDAPCKNARQHFRRLFEALGAQLHLIGARTYRSRWFKMCVFSSVCDAVRADRELVHIWPCLRNHENTVRKTRALGFTSISDVRMRGWPRRSCARQPSSSQPHPVIPGC